MAAVPTMAELLKLKEVNQVAIDSQEAKKKQLLAANKAAARLLLLGVMSTSSDSDYIPVSKHNWNGK